MGAFKAHPSYLYCYGIIEELLALKPALNHWKTVLYLSYCYLHLYLKQFSQEESKDKIEIHRRYFHTKSLIFIFTCVTNNFVCR